MSPEQKFGLSAELWLASQLKDRGYDCTYSSNFLNPGYDLLVCGVLGVSVKAARKRLRFCKGRVNPIRYQFNFVNCFRFSPASGFLIAALVPLPSGGFLPFFIPSSALIGRGLWLSITSDPLLYSGWAAPYRAAWSNVDYCLSRVSSLQLPLFEAFYG